MTLGQTVGNEGSNIFVSSMINNPTSTYQGCYADNTTSPLMTFVGIKSAIKPVLVIPIIN